MTGAVTLWLLRQAQGEEMSLEYRGGEGWSLTVAGDADKAPPEAAVVTRSQPQVMIGFGSVPSQAGF